ncbi:expressed unknown protein [Ectocarpus siliculosus]|uniref:PDZ domain-containing protein n=1 Tax=Ectocarpus siliculosus TaxID=2880 RepID=D8LNL1_ECTSI|nr:expressed unknown protein [Ectocarpus siliculosus]|eukprot:CBN76285.1 expressed unknown protein [Ectocarpus siliculosus]
MSPSHTLPARLPPSPGRMTGVEDTPGAGRWDGERHVTPSRQLPKAPGMGVEGPREEPWAAAEGAAAAAAADHASANVAKAGDHDDTGLVYEIAFPQAGALGLNLRTYLAEQPAGARLGLPPYGSLEVLDAQKFYLKAIVEPGDLLVAINGKKLTGSRFSFEDAIAVCSRASLPRVLRFARMKGASAAEIECAFGADVVCATFDAMDAPQQRLVTAQLHPSAPSHFFLNPPTRRGTKTPTAGTAAGGAEATAAAIGESAPSQSIATGDDKAGCDNV